jgi:hypothetical protein
LQRSCCGVFNENKKLRTAAHQQISDCSPSPAQRAALPLAEAILILSLNKFQPF